MEDTSESITAELWRRIGSGHADDERVESEEVSVNPAASVVEILTRTIKAHPLLSIGVALGIVYAFRLIRR